jgi:hypothetical protein
MWFKIYVGVRVIQGTESHIFCIGSDLIKFSSHDRRVAWIQSDLPLILQ